MYGSFQRFIIEKVAEQAHQKRLATLRPLHAAHASAVGIDCQDVDLVGAS